MTNAAILPGSFCWFELATTDQDAAKRFYTDLFGWTSTDNPMGPGASYTMFRLDGRDAAATYALQPEQRQQGVPPNWQVYVLVTSADDAAAKASSLGATVIVPPFDVMEHGRMSVIQDPTGAMIAVWQAKQHVGVRVWDEPGSVGWADLQVRDQATAGAFYSSLFGWKMVEGKSMNPAKPGGYFHIMNGDAMIGGIPPSGQVDPNAHPAWLMYVETTDCAASTKKAVSLGARVYVDTMAVGENGWISVIADPQGAVFALHQSAAR